MLPWIQALSFIPLVLAARARRLERRMTARFTDAGANTAERGILVDRDGPVAGFVFRRLHTAGVLQDAGNDRYYWNASAYGALRRRRRLRAFVVIAALVAGLAILVFRGDISL
jgi:hypothetical protein